MGDIKTFIVMIDSYAVRIDPDFAAEIAKHKWRVQKNSSGRCYVVRRKKDKTIYMHRQLTDAPDGMDVDHINGDSLDNRRANLRVCTRQQNLWNRGKRSNNKSGYKGVFFNKSTGKYSISFVLGMFDSPDYAASVYAEIAKKYHGEYVHVDDSVANG